MSEDISSFHLLAHIVMFLFQSIYVMDDSQNGDSSVPKSVLHYLLDKET